MPAQLLLNLFIAFLWMLLMDEDELKIYDFLCRLPGRDRNHIFHAPIFRNTILLAPFVCNNQVAVHFHIRADSNRASSC